MTEVDLQAVDSAITALREKYPDFDFRTNFDPTESGRRGILDVHITYKSRDISFTQCIVVPNSMTDASDYQMRIEAFMKDNFNIREQ